MKRDRFSGLKRSLLAVGRLFRRIANNPTTTLAALAFLVVGTGIVLYGFEFTQQKHDWKTFVEQIYSNLGVELISISLTVLVIEALNQRRATQERKEELILQMGSPDNSFAIEAVRILRKKGWLEDGSLRRADLKGARLEFAGLRRANLSKAILIGAHLNEANLVDALLSEANLRLAHLKGADLSGAVLSGANLQDSQFDDHTILPDGSQWTPDRNLRQFTHLEDWQAERSVRGQGSKH